MVQTGQKQQGNLNLHIPDPSCLSTPRWRPRDHNTALNNDGGEQCFPLETVTCRIHRVTVRPDLHTESRSLSQRSRESNQDFEWDEIVTVDVGRSRDRCDPDLQKARRHAVHGGVVAILSLLPEWRTLKFLPLALKSEDSLETHPTPAAGLSMACWWSPRVGGECCLHW